MSVFLCGYEWLNVLIDISSPPFTLHPCSVVDFMAYVEYGDGLCLPAEVGLASRPLVEDIEGASEQASEQAYSAIPLINYSDQRFVSYWAMEHWGRV